MGLHYSVCMHYCLCVCMWIKCGCIIVCVCVCVCGLNVAALLCVHVCALLFVCVRERERVIKRKRDSRKGGEMLRGFIVYNGIMLCILRENMLVFGVC